MTAKASPSPVAGSRTRPGRVAAASFIGTAIEWYDFFIYAMAAALVFGPLFFPEFEPLAGTLAAFATFAVGFLARPLSGVVMGHFGDRIGRKSMLVVSLMTMGIATVTIGLLPSYEQIGIWAPILLVTIRFVQGLGVGGEWSGAVLMAVEHAPKNRKGLYGSFPQMGVPAGLMLANLAFLGITSAVSGEAFLAWGWRVPFLASAALVVVGLFIRLTISESPEFERVKQMSATDRLPLLTVLRYSPKEIALAAGSFIGINAVGYIFMVYLLSYTTATLGMNRDQILSFVLLGALAWLIAIPVASAASDRHGRMRILLLGSTCLTVAAAALFPVVNTANPLLVLCVLIAAGTAMATVYGPLAAMFAETFPAEVRYSGSSLAYNLGAILGGGFAPIIATGLYARWHSSTPITLYLTAVSLLSLACIGLLAHRSLSQQRAGQRPGDLANGYATNDVTHD